MDESWPVTQGYGVPGPYVRGYHAGVDYGCNEETVVNGAVDGVVVWAGPQPQLSEYGVLVILEHESGWETYYAHLSRVLVLVGDMVLQGQVVALSGNTGRSDSPHLHVELRHNGEPVDPGEEWR